MNKIFFFITIVDHTHIEVERSMKLNRIVIWENKFVSNPSVILSNHLLHMVVQKLMYSIAIILQQF
jgi:hypothetical protein